MADNIRNRFSADTSTQFFNQSASSVSNDVTLKPQVYFNIDLLLLCYQGSEEFLLPYQIILCYVNPVSSIISMAVNTMCLAILRKSGLGKPSNIFLFALAVADNMNMFNNINVADILRYFGPVKSKRNYCTWEYDGQFNRFLEVSLLGFIFIGDWGQVVNATIPVIITTERILAVYFPVTFKKFLTPKATIASCCLAYTMWLPYVIFTIFLRRLAYFKLANGNVVGLVVSTDILYRNFNLIYNFLKYGMETLASWLPACFVCFGCLLIGVKVRLSMSKRRKLFGTKEKRKWSPRTTRTLLTSCLVFAVTHATNSIISASVPVETTVPMITFFVVRLSELINIINCSSNFLVYIISNRRLLQTFLDIIGMSKRNI